MPSELSDICPSWRAAKIAAITAFVRDVHVVQLTLNYCLSRRHVSGSRHSAKSDPHSTRSTWTSRTKGLVTEARHALWARRHHGPTRTRPGRAPP